MGIFITFLTFILVMNCLILILLVLIQLPKKETGAGLAFGAGTTDALFGAGSGNVLTKITKYAAGSFLVLAMLLSVLNISHAANKRGGGVLQKELEKASRVPIPTAATTPAKPTAGTPPLATPLTTSNFAPVDIPQPGTPSPAPAPAPAPAPEQPKK